MRTFREFTEYKVAGKVPDANPVREDIIRKEVYRQICYMTADEQIKELSQFWREARSAGDKDAQKVALEELNKRDIAIFTR